MIAVRELIVEYIMTLIISFPAEWKEDRLSIEDRMWKEDPGGLRSADTAVYICLLLMK